MYVALWWKRHEHLYPTVALVARQFFGIPSSQCECERTFSVTGVVTQNRRSNMSVERMNEIIQIHMNISNFKTFCSEQEPTLISFIQKEQDLLERFSDLVAEFPDTL